MHRPQLPAVPPAPPAPAAPVLPGRRAETQADDELKLMAINAMLNTDPERAAPLLEKVLQGNHPPKLKAW